MAEGCAGQCFCLSEGNASTNPLKRTPRLSGPPALARRVEKEEVIRRLRAGRKMIPMSPDVSELLKKALALPPEARAALAGSLLESLDDAIDPSAEDAWKREIARRMEELDSGKVKPIPWAEARRQIAALLNGR